MTRRGIKENSDKCVAIIDMRGPTSMKGPAANRGDWPPCPDFSHVHGQILPLFCYSKVEVRVDEWVRTIQSVKFWISLIWQTEWCLGQWSCQSMISISSREAGSKLRFWPAFLTELRSLVSEKVSHVWWILSVDGPSNLKGSGDGIVLEGPGNILKKQSLRFEFRISNNQTEIEALIIGMNLTIEMCASNLIAQSDSQLIANQVTCEY